MAGCAVLHTLHFRNALATDVSALASCAALHTLELTHSRRLREVSALGSCAALQNLCLSDSLYVSDVSAGCAALHTLNLCFTSVHDVSALAGCATLYSLNLEGCCELTDRWRAARRWACSTSQAVRVCRMCRRWEAA